MLRKYRPVVEELFSRLGTEFLLHELEGLEHEVGAEDMDIGGDEIRISMLDHHQCHFLPVPTRSADYGAGVDLDQGSHFPDDLEIVLRCQVRISFGMGDDRHETQGSDVVDRFGQILMIVIKGKFDQNLVGISERDNAFFPQVFERSDRIEDLVTEMEIDLQAVFPDRFHKFGENLLVGLGLREIVAVLVIVRSQKQISHPKAD